MNREQFEKLKSIESKLGKLGKTVQWSDKFQIYHAMVQNVDALNDVRFVNGAWYAWQERQKKIDELIAINESLVAYKNELLEELK